MPCKTQGRVTCFGDDMRRVLGMPRARIVLTACAAAAVVLVSQAARAEFRSVSVSSANFRTGPSTKEPIMFTADRYYPVQVLGCKDGWCETKDFEGDHAWVAERLLSDQAAVVVNVDRANIRHEPTTGSKVLFRVDWGEALKVTECRDDWLAIEDIEGATGWLFAELAWGVSKPRTEGKSKTEKKTSE